MGPRVRLEPTTFCIIIQCSTTWPWHVWQLARFNSWGRVIHRSGFYYICDGANTINLTHLFWLAICSDWDTGDVWLVVSLQPACLCPSLGMTGIYARGYSRSGSWWFNRNQHLFSFSGVLSLYSSICCMQAACCSQPIPILSFLSQPQLSPLSQGLLFRPNICDLQVRATATGLNASLIFTARTWELLPLLWPAHHTTAREALDMEVWVWIMLNNSFHVSATVGINSMRFDFLEMGNLSMSIPVLGDWCIPSPGYWGYTPLCHALSMHGCRKVEIIKRGPAGGSLHDGHCRRLLALPEGGGPWCARGTRGDSMREYFF